MRKLIAAALVLAAIPAVAQQGAPVVPGAKDVGRVTAGTYAVDPEHTIVRWTVDHFGFSPYFGLFGQPTGTLTLAPRNLRAAKVDITIPVADVTTASKGLTAHLLRPGKDGGKPDFFGPNPAAARFTSTSVTVDSDGDEAKVAGNLTLNGVTRPVVLDVDFYGAGKSPAMGGRPSRENVGFTAEATIRRSDFGINTALPLVSDKVELDITAAFVKQ